MLLKLITLLVIGCTVANTSAVVPHEKIQSDFNKLLTDSVNFLQNNPDRYKECYTYYEPRLTQVGNVYGKEVGDCRDIAQQNHTNIGHDSQVIAAKSDVSKSAETICSSLQICEKIGVPLDSFQCYTTTGEHSSVASNGIKFKSIDIVEYIQNLIRDINSQENLCVNTASEKYTQDWAFWTQQLQTCFITYTPLYPTTASPIYETTTEKISTPIA